MKFMKKITQLILIIAISGFSHSAFSQNRGSEPDLQKEKLLELADSLSKKYQAKKAEVERMALEKGWSIRTESEFGETEYQYIDELGMPQATQPIT
jgi:hypothetical protein